MTLNKPPLEVESPFDEEPNSTLIDMVKHTGLGDLVGPVLRVELRRVREPVMVDPTPQTMTVEESFVVGLIPESELPQLGQRFKMSYHALSTNSGYGHGPIIDFGQIDTKVPIENLVVADKEYFFETSEGLWRLKVLDTGS
jgi:hypothetical protein